MPALEWVQMGPQGQERPSLPRKAPDGTWTGASEKGQESAMHRAGCPRRACGVGGEPRGAAHNAREDGALGCARAGLAGLSGQI